HFRVRGLQKLCVKSIFPSYRDLPFCLWDSVAWQHPKTLYPKKVLCLLSPTPPRICLPANNRTDGVYLICERFLCEILRHSGLCENRDTPRKFRHSPRLTIPF